MSVGARPKLRWFSPVAEFALAEPRPPPESLPLLLVLPGLDGSGITAWTQYPELAQDYEVRALCIPPEDRSSFDALVDEVAATAAAAAEEDEREVLLLGESMGAGVALKVLQRRPSPLAGVVLVSPATGWGRTWLGRLRGWLVTLPDAALATIVALTTYQLLDADQLLTTLRRIVTGDRSPLLATPAREEYAWAVVGSMTERLASPAGAIRHRISQWAQPSIDAGADEALAALDERVPVLIVAGTADLRVPAEEEAIRLQRAAPNACEVHLVEGAGHAGVTDDRVDLRALLARWRREGGVTPPERLGSRGSPRGGGPPRMALEAEAGVTEASADLAHIISSIKRWYTGAPPPALTHVVAAEHAGLRIGKVGGTAFSALGSKSQAAAAVKRGDLTLGGETVETSRRLREGDVLTLQLPAQPAPAAARLESRARFVHHLRSSGLRAAYEDDELAVVYKPAGVHTKRGSNAKYAALEDALAAELTPPPAEHADALPLPLAMHRLDVPVAGLTVVAKTRRASRHLAKQFEEHAVAKVYHALLVGNATAAGLDAADDDQSSHDAFVAAAAAAAAAAAEADGAPPRLSTGCWRWAWWRWDRSSHRTAAGQQRRLELNCEIDGREASSTLEVIDVVPHPQWGHLSHVRMSPHTGRNHQLRLHAAALGCPIVGDDLYWGVAAAARASRGAELPPLRVGSGIYLASAAVRLEHPLDGAELHVSVAEPPKFGALMARARSGAEYERAN